MVPRGQLWKVCEEYGVSAKVCGLLRALYATTKSAVRVHGELTNWFEVKSGLRQGCLLSPALFNMYIYHVLRLTLEDVEAQDRVNWGQNWRENRSRIRVEYRMPDGSRARGNLVSGTDALESFLYADDLVFVCKDA